ncbi:hypothetical protein FKM82_025394 [Ascaphus truei]
MLDHGTALGRLAAWASTGDGGPETLRVLGFLGGTLEDSWVLRGAVMPLEPLGTRRQTGSARLALYLCPFGEQKTRAAGTARLCGARELEELGPGRERVEEARVGALIQAGVTVLAVAGAVSELALHFCDRAGLLAVRLERRSQARELELATGARALLADHRAPEDEELGRCQRVYPSEIGGQPVVVFEPHPGAGKGLVTVVVRGATEELLGAAEEAVRGAVQCCRALREEPRMVAGAGAAEVEVSLHLEALGRGQPGLEQHGLLAFARALETLPRALARNWGLDEARAMGELRARHLAGETGAGVGEEEDGAPPAAVLDPLVVKRRAIELATEVAVTLLGCGQVVVAKKSGGPRFRGDNPNWDLEPDLIDCETP